MSRPSAVIAVLLLTVALGACGKDSSPVARDRTATATTETTATAAQTAPAARKTESGCEPVPAPAPGSEGNRKRAGLRLDRGKTWTATLVTNCGTIRIRLDVKGSPKTTASFVALARDHFYDGLTFHRIAKPGGSDFVIQGGDPTGSGNGGPGYKVVEPPPRDARYRRGVVAMAKTEIEDPGTSGSQFFIVTAQDAGLPPDYAILGRVVGGQQAVKRIAAVPTDPATEMPSEPVVMKKVTIRDR